MSSRARALLLTTALLALTGCASTLPEAPTQTAAPARPGAGDPRAGDFPLERSRRATDTFAGRVTFLTSTGEEDYAPIQPGESIATGAHVRFVVELPRPAHVYVFDESTSGWRTLFPRAEAATTSLLPPGRHELPGGGRFTMDGDGLGFETLHVVISERPVPTLEDAARATSQPLVTLPSSAMVSAAVDLGGRLTLGVGAGGGPHRGALSFLHVAVPPPPARHRTRSVMIEE